MRLFSNNGSFALILRQLNCKVKRVYETAHTYEMFRHIENQMEDV